MDKKELRAVFKKTGRTVFISHLDLMRTMQRAIKRSDIPVWYTEGFNPRIYLMFPLALSLGVESKVEIMDFAVTDKVDYEDIKCSINKNLPDEIQILKVYEPVNNLKDIGYSEYCVTAECQYNSEIINNKFNDFKLLDKVIIEKRTKKGEYKTVDIKPYLDIYDVKCDNHNISFFIRLPSGVEFNINSSLAIEALDKYMGFNFNYISVQRTKILTNNDKLFI